MSRRAKSRGRTMVGLWAAIVVALGSCAPPTGKARTPGANAGGATSDTTGATASAGATATGATSDTTSAPATAAGAPSAAGMDGGRTQVALAPDAMMGAVVLGAPAPVAAGADATIETLPDDATQALLARLEPLPEVALANARAPALRAPSAMPARPGPVTPIAMIGPGGTVVADAPIAPRAAAAKAIAPLAPPEISPQGDVRSESEIRVRFGEAMVPVAAVGPAATAPATITPAVPGSWRWLDTRVAVFTTAAARLPQATAFTVTVPAGTRALSGAALAAAAEARFATGAPRIVDTFPRGTLRPDSAIALRFDQDVDPAAIARALRVHRGGATLPFRVVGERDAIASWRRNPSLAAELKDTTAALAEPHVLIAPATAWPSGAELRAVLAAGAPSREGPLTATAESAADVAIAPAFTVEGLVCGRSDRPRRTAIRCPANSALEVAFSSELDDASFRAPLIQLEAQPFEDVTTHWGGVYLSIPPGAGRHHAVVIGDGLRDVYDQPLTGARRLPFTTGPEEFTPWGDAPSGLIVLDPRFAIPQWVVSADAVASVTVELYAVTPADWFAYADHEDDGRAPPPGRRAFSRTYPIGARRGAKIAVDLRPALASTGLGHVIAVARFTPIPGTPKELMPMTQQAWLQVTRLGVSARLDGDDVHAWVQDLAPGRALAPVAGAATSIVVEGLPPNPPALTDGDGHATVPLLPPEDGDGGTRARAHPRDPRSALLEVATADDATFTVIDGRYRRAIRKDEARWYVTDDRFLYKPGEEVHVKGWVRWTDDGKDPDLALPRTGEEVAYQLTDDRGVKLAAGKTRFTAQGGFDLTLELPSTANLGTATLALTSRGSTFHHWFDVEEFRPPAFAVTLDDDVTHRGAAPLYAGDQLELAAGAAYYAGGGLPGAQVSWDVTLEATSYRPPGWDDYGFAPLDPRSTRGTYAATPPAVTAGRAAALDARSSAGLTIGLPALPLGRPSILAIDATITDVDRTTIRASSRPILVHPASWYIGVRARPGERGALDVVVTDVDGEAVAGVPVDVAIEGVLGSERTRDDATIVDTQRCALTSAATPVTCHWTPLRDELAYAAVARAHDGRGRAVATRYEVPWWTLPDRRDSLAIVPDRASYRPGDVAHLAVRSTVVPATAVLTVARRGVLEQRRLALTTASTIVDVAIADGFVPDVHVIVDRWGPREENRAPDRGPLPGHESAELELPVDLDGARLTMRARPTEPLVEPGAPATFELEVRHGDRPVANAEVALMVVDEAVLALTGGTHADPLPGFYQRVPAGTRLSSTLPLVQDAGPDVAGAPGVVGFGLSGFGPGGGGSGAGYGTIGTGAYGTIGHGAGGSSVIAARKDFRATAVFSPALHTDAEGKARVTVTMPDSLTRFRVVALATASTRWFGKAEGTIVTQRKLNARTVAPRFLTVGDRFSLPVVVQNLERTPRTIDVAVRAANLAALGAQGRRVTVGGGQRAEVRFDLATAGRGQAVIQTIAVSGDAADASQVKLPVYEPATTEAFATYGTVDDGAAFEALQVPDDLYPDVGGVEVELASTQLQELTDAYGYLYAYPYECAEQRSARMLATAAMADVLDAFAVPGRPARADLDATIAADLRELQKDQLADGSWGYWPGMDGDPFVTMQVLRALVAAHGAPRAIERATRHVERVAVRELERLAREAARPLADRKRLDELPYDVGLAATALAALAAAGTDVVPRALKLHASATALAAYPIDAKARLLAILAGDPRAVAVRAELVRALVSATHETAAAATVTARFAPAERLLLVSENRTSALALDALLREAPEHPLVTKLARGLLAARSRGRWISTQENLAALTALRRYFDVHEAVTPDFRGRLWFGSAAYAERTFHGRETVRARAEVGWPALGPGTTHELALVKEGAGRMYYRIGIRYAPRRADLPPLDAGFLVRRSYAAIDDPADVVRTATGWRIRLGARVRVTIEALSTSDRHGVAVVDPIPAGFETIDEALAIAERVGGDDDDEDDAWDHRNLRDDRSEAFAMDLPAGSHRFSYAARAATPGTFLAAPARAEEMYMPETFGRSAGATVEIR